jgi:hypothetical protein
MFDDHQLKIHSAYKAVRQLHHLLCRMNPPLQRNRNQSVTNSWQANVSGGISADLHMMQTLSNPLRIRLERPWKTVQNHWPSCHKFWVRPMSWNCIDFCLYSTPIPITPMKWVHQEFITPRNTFCLCTQSGHVEKGTLILCGTEGLRSMWCTHDQIASMCDRYYGGSARDLWFCDVHCFCSYSFWWDTSLTNSEGESDVTACFGKDTCDHVCHRLISQGSVCEYGKIRTMYSEKISSFW